MNIFEIIKSEDSQAVPAGLHRKIMVNIWLLKIKPLLVSSLGLFSIAAVWFMARVYKNIVETGSWEVIKSTFSGLDVDLASWLSLQEGLYEVIPVSDVVYSSICIIVTIVVYHWLTKMNHLKSFVKI